VWSGLSKDDLKDVPQILLLLLLVVVLVGIDVEFGEDSEFWMILSKFFYRFSFYPMTMMKKKTTKMWKSTSDCYCNYYCHYDDDDSSNDSDRPVQLPLLTTWSLQLLLVLLLVDVDFCRKEDCDVDDEIHWYR
jgi:hypothetical protein